ncbi:MAG: KR domain-containing protein, partial [Chloroflexi bacterium]|nr:KR domain-containing protein [Chloroflexota bacterium]
MPTILILGGTGLTGRALTNHLLAQTNADILIAGRNFEKAQSFAMELRNSRARPVQVDATKYEDFRHALKGVTLCLVAAHTTHAAKTVIRSCLEARVDYLDIQYSSKKLASLLSAKDQIQQAGLCFVTEAGYHPGLPAAMVRFAASKMDLIESALTAGYLNLTGIPYTDAVDELMESFIDYQAQVFKNGAWTRKNKWEMRSFDFGKEIGRRTCYSMFFEELRALPQMYPSLKETGFYISGSNWITDTIVTPLVMMGLKIAPRRGLRPLGRLTWWAMQQSKPPYLVALQVEAKGLRNGMP